MRIATWSQQNGGIASNLPRPKWWSLTVICRVDARHHAGWTSFLLSVVPPPSITCRRALEWLRRKNNACTPCFSFCREPPKTFTFIEIELLDQAERCEPVKGAYSPFAVCFAAAAAKDFLGNHRGPHGWHRWRPQRTKQRIDQYALPPPRLAGRRRPFHVLVSVAAHHLPRRWRHHAGWTSFLTKPGVLCAVPFLLSDLSHGSMSHARPVTSSHP